MKAPYPVDLHSHTVNSDGNDTPYELVMNTVNRGVQILAVTDHDVIPPKTARIPGNGELDLVEFAKSQGVALFRGIEFSCETTVQDVHIVGLGCDWDGDIMVEEARQIAHSKANAYIETVRRLNERGYAMDMEEILSLGGKRIDILELQKKRIFDMMALKGYTPDWKSAKLLVREDPYLSVEREKPSGIHIIDAIHRAGGIAILAHPMLIDEVVEKDGRKMTRWEYIDTLVEAGLDGIEGRYTYDKTSCKDKRKREEIWQDVLDRYTGRLFISAGSDYHADAKKGTANQRELGECGLTLAEFMSVPKLKELFDKL
ncbi:MAG: PHP domain-containing protein [Christensenellales bacterium]|jgi:predicted metal-dependent phosphoesterase TrpH